MSLTRLAMTAILFLGIQLPAHGQDIFADGFEPIEVCDGIDNDGAGGIDDDCVFCSPLDPTPVCGINSHCTPQADAKSICSTPAGNQGQGQVCSQLADCAASFACVGTQFGQSCLRWCQRPIGACPAGLSCTGLVPQVYTGATEWGVCL